MKKLLTFRPALRLLLCYAVLIFLGLFAFLALLTFLAAKLEFGQGYIGFFWKPFLILGAIYLIHGLLWRITSKYTLTDEAVSSHSGILSRRRIRIPLNRVVDYQVITPFLERVFFLGSVHIDTAGEEQLIMYQLHKSDIAIVAMELDILLKREQRRPGDTPLRGKSK